LPATLGPGAVEGGSIGGDAEDHHYRWPEVRHLSFQLEATASDLGGREFVGSSRGAVDDVGYPHAPRGQVGGVLAGQSTRGVDFPFAQAGQVQGRVEAVAPFGEMGLGGGGP